MAYGLGKYGVRAFGRSIRLGSIEFEGVSGAQIVPSRRRESAAPVSSLSHVTLAGNRVRLDRFQVKAKVVVTMDGERLRPSVFPVFAGVSTVYMRAERVIFNSMSISEQSSMTISGRGIYTVEPGERPSWSEAAEGAEIWESIAAEETAWTEAPVNV